MSDKKFASLIIIILLSVVVNQINFKKINTRLEYIETKATEGWVKNRIMNIRSDSKIEKLEAEVYK